MELVIIESPFAGGQNIDFKFQPLNGAGTSWAATATAKGALFEHNDYGPSKVSASKRAAMSLCTEYARAAMRDCLLRGEAPYASHLLYTQDGVLNDDYPDERALGIEAGLCWGKKASKTVVYIDLGISNGMAEGIQRAKREGRPIEQRTLPGWS